MLKLTKTLTLHVTADRIARAEPGCGTCPVALAITDRGFEAAVGKTAATVSISGILTPADFAHYRLPHRARRLVYDFDAGLPVQAATFRITRTSA